MSDQQNETTTRSRSRKSDEEVTFPLRLVKVETGETHWDTAQGRWVPVTHAETGEPASEYRLLATIDGVDVPLGSYNAGRVETVVRAQQQAQQSDKA